MCAMCVSVLVPCRGRFVHVHRSHTQLIFSWVNFTINCKPGYFFPSGVFPPCSFLPSSLPFIFCTVWKPLLSPVSPVLCQFVSNLQLLRLFSSLLPLGSVSGTVFFFFLKPLYSPISPLSLHSAHPLSQPVSSICHPCLSVLAHTSFPHGEVLGSDHLALTQIKFPLTFSVDLGSRNLVKALDASPGVTGRQWGSSAPSKLFFLFICSLVLLVILNMMLFYKLWMLEYTTQTLTAWQGLRLQERYCHTSFVFASSCMFPTDVRGFPRTPQLRAVW